MSKKKIIEKAASPNIKNSTAPTKNVNEFFDGVARIIEQARAYVGRTVDLTMCVTYFEIGRMIVEEEQGGKARAAYGSKLLKELSVYLTDRLGRGFSLTNLKNAKKFYLTYATLPKNTQKGQSITDQFIEPQNSQSITDLFIVSWTHYVVLMRIKNESERRFYELEAANQKWSVEDLKRQYNSSLYERLALSRDKDEVMRLAKEGQTIEKPRDMLKNPLVLEFLNMVEDTAYNESDLESAIIGKLQKFLLELGKGFLFEARQKRFSFDEQSFFVDLVFYNRLLQCYVIIDLKTTVLKHQDLGQMQMYVHYFDRYVKNERERPTVGILLCREKSDTIVSLTLAEGENIYASEYSLYLPDKTLLQQKLVEWTQEFEETHGTIEAARHAVESEEE